MMSPSVDKEIVKMLTTTKTVVLSILIALSCSLWAGASNSKELLVPGETTIYVTKGFFCDTEDELLTVITGVHLQGGTWPEEIPDGCGFYSPSTPIPMLVTPLYWYETPSVFTLVAQFVYEPTGYTMFGWIAYVPNPDYVPSAPGSDA